MSENKTDLNAQVLLRMLEDKDTEAKTPTKLMEKLQANLDVGKSKQVKSIGYETYHYHLDCDLFVTV